jgi:DNA-binding MarR family transcriptional regulator
MAVTAFELGQLYLGLHHRFHRIVDEAMTEAGLSFSRAKVLTVLAERGAIKQATIAACLGFAPRSVTDTLDALERDGLAARRTDPQDRRAWLVELTPAGSAALEQAMTVKRQAMDTIFGSLDAEDRKNFATLLESISTQLDARNSRTESTHVG